MNVDMVRNIYGANPVVRAICDHMAARDKSWNETKLHRILINLGDEGHDIRKAEVIAAFRQLEEADCGKYVEGRHGWKSRFVWSVKSALVAAAAQGNQAQAAAAVADTDDQTDESDMLEHVFWLRPDLSVTIELPADLSVTESQRLSQFVGALAFDDVSL